MILHQTPILRLCRLAGAIARPPTRMTKWEPENGDEEPAGIKPDDRPVTSQSNDWNISTLREKMERGFLVLQPSYQREYVWKLKPELRPRLVESLLLEIPYSSPLLWQSV